MLSTERLHQALTGRPFRYYESLSSSNDSAMRWLNEGASAGSIIVANEQTQGRGRLGRTWYAPPGTALMFSYLLRPQVEELPYIGMMGALAVAETLKSLGVAACGIKWPNDVQIDGRKVSGVLPEATWQSNKLLGVVLGIGINVRIDFTGTAFTQTAVSLESVISSVDRVDLLRRIVTRLDDWSSRLSSDELFEQWRDSMLMMGRRVSINHVTGTVDGIAEVVDRQGALLVRDSGGTLTRVIAGDIALG